MRNKTKLKEIFVTLLNYRKNFNLMTKSFHYYWFFLHTAHGTRNECSKRRIPK